MIVNKSKFASSKILVDLTGPQGNAMVLLGMAQDLCRKTGLSYRDVSKEMMDGDYEHLVQTLDKHFGHVLILMR